MAQKKKKPEKEQQKTLLAVSNIFRTHLLPEKSEGDLSSAIKKIKEDLDSFSQELSDSPDIFNKAIQFFILPCLSNKAFKDYVLQFFAHYLCDEIEDKRAKVSFAMFLCEILSFPEKLLITEVGANKCLKIADNDEPILLLGETGTGKELHAKMFHYLSNRKEKAFVPINCGGLNESTLSSELFGHEKSAFTGANEKKIGGIERADGGTLFLDEVGDMSIKTQIALLRFLNDGKFQRLGKTGVDISVDVRVIAATNKDLNKKIKKGLFREDLYYRLNVFPFTLPSLMDLKNRLEEIIATKILPIASRFGISKEATVYTGNMSGWLRQSSKFISPDALDILIKYNYPGNYRQLENILKYSCRMCDDKIQIKDLHPDVLATQSQAKQDMPSDSWINLSYKELTERLDDLHKKKVESTLKDAKGYVSEAARMLDIPRYMLDRTIAKMGINIKNFK